MIPEQSGQLGVSFSCFCDTDGRHW